METYALIAYIVAAMCFIIAVLAGTPRRADSTAPGWLAYSVWIPLGLLAWVSVALVTAIRAQ